jgi:hypothetical protein
MAQDDTDVSLASPRDLLVNMIAKAITTGLKIDGNLAKRHADVVFYAGRISGLTHAAAMTAHVLYGADFVQAKRLVRRGVEGVHLSWSDDDLRDEGRVGNEADAIATRVLDAR